MGSITATRLLRRRPRVRPSGMKSLLLAATVLIVSNLSTAATTVAAASSPAVPGTRPANAADPPSSALAPFINVTGHVSISVDGLGTNNPAGGAINVQKSSGATVRQALLFAASTGFTGYVPVDGDVTVDGAPVSWDPAHTISNSINSYNVAADITSMVKPKLDAAPAGLVSFTVAEPSNTYLIDGEILAVIFDDPSVTVNKSITLLYGAQNTTGDSFNVALTQPINKTDPNQQLTFGLGISYGYQAPGILDQYSLIDVNGQRLSSAAGGQDDCDQKYAATPDFASCDNGALLTVGGIGDSTANPTDPNATPQDACVPRCDDELYDLMPFVNNGDTSFTIHTLNPSNDDNIFFGWLLANPPATVSTAGCVTFNVKPNAGNASETDINGSCMTPGEKVDVLLNTEAGAILLDQPTVSATGTFSDTFAVPDNFNIPLPKAKGFSSVTVPVREESSTQPTIYQLDVIGEKAGDGGRLQVRADGNYALVPAETNAVTTSGPACSAANVTAPPAAAPTNLSTSGQRWILDPNGKRVKLASVNWYGAEQADFVVGGLQCQSISTIAAVIRNNQFNSVRLPFSNAMLEEDPGSCGATPTPFEQPCIAPGLLLANQTLQSSDALGIYRAVIQALGRIGVMVVLDDHTTDAQWSPGAGNGVWWGGVLWDDLVAPLNCPFGDSKCWHRRIALWKNDWITMVNLFQGEANVIGVDLRNEPDDNTSYLPLQWCSSSTCPGDTGSPIAGPVQFEWGPTAEWAGNAVLSALPPGRQLLIIVEGLQLGQDLTQVYHHWLTLQSPGHLVYSAHSYPFYRFGSAFAYSSLSQTDLATTLGNAWGFIVTQNQDFTAPVWVGEFGDCNGGSSCSTSAFENNFIAYLKGADFDWAWWPINYDYSNGGSSKPGQSWFMPEQYGVLNSNWSDVRPTGLTGKLPYQCAQGPCP